MFSIPFSRTHCMAFNVFFFPLMNASDGILIFPGQQGETGANVLVGIQVPQSEMDEFRERADKLGYDYTVVNNDDDFQLLMH